MHAITYSEKSGKYGTVPPKETNKSSKHTLRNDL